MPILHQAPSVSDVPDLAARLMLEAPGGPGAWLVLVPGFEVAARLRAALAAQLRDRGVMGVAAPRVVTLESLIEGVDHARAVTPRVRRLAELRQVLAARGWFGGAPSWDACQSILDLADELSARLPEPPDEAAFLRVVETCYRGRATRLAEPEARLIHEVWRAYARPVAGAPLDPGMARRMRVSAAARACDRPVVWLSARPGAPLDADEQAFLTLVETRHPVHLVAPAELPGALALAWPAQLDEPVRERAARLDGAARALLRGIEILRASSLEAEARGAARKVATWLAEGRRDIAIVARDHVAARRVRALLERENVLLEDESGWILSTTRAGACAMGWVETVAGGFAQRDLLDWLHSPFAFADLPRDIREAGIAALDAAVRRHNVTGNLTSMRRALVDAKGGREAALTLLQRVETAARAWERRAASPATWCEALSASLATLGAADALAADAAGAPLLERLAEMGEHLAGTAPVSLSVWRDFLAAELELVSFRDPGIASSVVMTSLERLALRRFDAVLLVGGGEAHLNAREARGMLFGERLRGQLGLDTSRERSLVLRDALAAAIGAAEVFCATWMAGGERDPQRLSPWLSRIDALAVAAGLPSRLQAFTLPRPVPRRAVGTAPPAPAAPALLPSTVSASAYASLIACPYRFFARHMLGLNEMDQVREEFEKRDYGTWVHELLARLHARIPVFLDVAPEVAVSAFTEIAERVFAEAVAFNYLSLGWKTRVVGLAPAYVEWQRARESAGWRWQEGEWQRTLPLTLASGTVVELAGRLDRVDRRADGAIAILDYKTRKESALKAQVKTPGEDVQLAVYALLKPEGILEQAAYVAFDEEPVKTVAANAHHDAADERARLTRVLSAIESGAPLPANAPESTCAWCEMRGLCRRDHWSAEGGDA